MASSKKGYNLQQLKGLPTATEDAYNDDALSSIADAINSGAKWVYNWDSTIPSFVLDALSAAGISFVPTIWDSSHKVSDALAQQAAPKYILGFNEPDQSSQANMTTTQVIDSWAAVADAAPSGSILVGPAISDGAWDFMTTVYDGLKSNGYRFDAFGYHVYRTDLNSFTLSSSTHSIPWMADRYGVAGVISEIGFTNWSEVWPFKDNRMASIIAALKTFWASCESSDDVLLYSPFITHGVEAREKSAFNWSGLTGGNYTPLYKAYASV